MLVNVVAVLLTGQFCTTGGKGGCPSELWIGLQRCYQAAKAMKGAVVSECVLHF